MIEGEYDTSSGPKRNGRHFFGRLYQLSGWPPRLEFPDRDFYNFSLDMETETESENVKVSMNQDQDFDVSKLLRLKLFATL